MSSMCFGSSALSRAPGRIRRTKLALDAGRQPGSKPGLSVSANQEREASGSIAGEPMRRITYLSNIECCPYRIPAAMPERLGSAPGPRGIFPEDGVQSLGEEIRVQFRKDQWRTQLDDVVMRPVRAGEDTAVAQPIDDVGSLKRCRLSRFAI